MRAARRCSRCSCRSTFTTLPRRVSAKTFPHDYQRILAHGNSEWPLTEDVYLIQVRVLVSRASWGEGKGLVRGGPGRVRRMIEDFVVRGKL